MFPFDLILTSAMAADVPASAVEVSPITSALTAILPIVAVMYFIMFRPHQKRVKEYEAMSKSLKRGDKIVTGGGVIGTIQKMEGDDILVVEIAPDVKIRILRDTVSHVLNKSAGSETANDNAVGSAKAENKK